MRIVSLAFCSLKRLREMDQQIEELHRIACNNKKTFYEDPTTGFSVFTEYAHLKRGKCCGSACRHCPYHHQNVTAQNLNKKGVHILKFDTSSNEEYKSADVLFWSGGKDSFLAYLDINKERKVSFSNRKIYLLTTFSGETGIVAHQEVEFQKIMDQARHLSVDLVSVPLYSSVPYHTRVTEK